MGHHFVPQRYLRSFGDPNRPGFIWVHDKRGGPPRQAAIDHVAQSRQFYSEETETILAREVEAPANAVMGKLTQEKEISRDERLHLAHYIAVMLKRIPARRRCATEMIPGVLADVTAELRERLKSLESLQADPAALARKLQEIDAAEKKFRRDPPPEVLKQIREPWPSEKMHWALFTMTWRVLVSAGPIYFVTTDNPAFFFRAFGLAREKSELCFPISRTHALHGSWTRVGRDLIFVKATQGIVKEVNRRLASETERLGFYHEPAPWLLRMLAKKRPHLSVIQWLD